MFPILLHIGPITLRTYGAMVALAFLVSLQVAKWTTRTRRLGQAFILDLVAILVVSGLAGARILYVLLNLSYFREHPFESLKVWEGGLVFYGGFLLATAAGVAFTRIRGYGVADVADSLAAPLAIGQGIGRWGCFFAGCCYGKPTSVLWGIQFSDPSSLAPLGISLHPTQIYESIGDLLIGAFLWRMLARRKDTRGNVFCLYLLLYGVLRFGVEMFRGDDRGVMLGGLFPSQVVALVALLVSGSILLVQKLARHDAHP
jgi:phosphatidylglycerol---prolipoprotein diacylglyceryl transferase